MAASHIGWRICTRMIWRCKGERRHMRSKRGRSQVLWMSWQFVNYALIVIETQSYPLFASHKQIQLIGKGTLTQSRLVACIVVGRLHVEGIFCFRRCLIAQIALDSGITRCLKHFWGRQEERPNEPFRLMRTRTDHNVRKILSFALPCCILLSQRMREAAATKQDTMRATKPH